MLIETKLSQKKRSHIEDHISPMKIYWGKYADDTDMNAPFQRVSTLC